MLCYFPAEAELFSVVKMSIQLIKRADVFDVYLYLNWHKYMSQSMPVATEQ